MRDLNVAGWTLAMAVLVGSPSCVLGLASISGQDTSLLRRMMDGTEEPRSLPQRRKRA
jgi:hypothetical protein